MRSSVLLLLALLLSGCAFIAPRSDAIFVQVQNETELTFTEVVLELGYSDESRSVFEDVPPGTETRFQEIEEGFSQPYTVRAQTADQEFVFNAVAAFAIPLEPGMHTYTLTLDEAGRLRVMERPTDQINRLLVNLSL